MNQTAHTPDERWETIIEALPANSEALSYAVGIRDELAGLNPAAYRQVVEACKAAKTYLEPDLVEPGRTVFWKLVKALAAAQEASHAE